MVNDIREIVTRTVVAKGRKKFIVKTTLENLNNISSVLGCWIINHEFNTELHDNDVIVNGSFESDVWYATNDNSNTEVYKQTTSYEGCIHTRKIPADLMGDNLDIISRVISQPTCIKANIENNNVILEIAFELIVEIIGESKIMVNILQLNEFIPEVDDLENEINEDFLKEG